MTPLEIEILLHYATRATDYRNGDFSAPAVRDAVERFVGAGLLVERDPGQTPLYWMLERGHAYVDALCKLPLPVQVWVIPKEAK